jgi:hypothetical protein
MFSPITMRFAPENGGGEKLDGAVPLSVKEWIPMAYFMSFASYATRLWMPSLDVTVKIIIFSPFESFLCMSFKVSLSTWNTS